MDEKTGTMSSGQRTLPGGRVRVLIATAILSFWFLAFYYFVPFYGTSTNWDGDWTSVEDAPAGANRKLVPVEAHIMSKCSDARDCLREMVLPAMQRVGDKVNFTLSFIGTPTDNDGVACKHGPAECLGNIIELCAQRLTPNRRPTSALSCAWPETTRRSPSGA